MLATTVGSRPSPTVHLKATAIGELAAAHGWSTDKEIAQGVGTSAANLCRLLNPDHPQTPGTTFIATILRRFPDKAFEDFFEVADPEPAEAAA